jgi:hypothetical protein
MAYSKRPPLGQDVMADSEPVVIASDQSAIPVTNAGITTIAGAVSGTEMQVDVLTLPALAAGTNNIGDVDVLTLPALPAGTNNIGDIDVLTLVGISALGQATMANSLPVVLASNQAAIPVTQSGTWNVGTVTTLSTLTTITNAVTVAQATASSLKNEPAGNVAHDAADSGNPLKVGAKAVSSLASATMVAAADRTDNVSDIDGTLIVRPQFPLGDLKHQSVTNTDGASTASTVFTAVASTRNYITAIHVYRTDAGTTPIYVDFRDGTGGAILWSMVLPPNGGSIIALGGMPIFRTSANTALAFDVSAATTTVTLNISGYQSKA